MFTVPPGRGKTRIALCTCFFLTKLKDITKISIVFPNERMKEREIRLYQLVAKAFGGIEVLLVTANEFNFKSVNAGHVVIIDEADNCLLDQQMKLPERGTGMVIGFTATAFKTEKGVEENFLNVKSFIVFDSKMVKNEPLQPVLISVQDFFKLHAQIKDD